MTVQFDRQQLFQYSYRRGITIFLYGLIWLVATIAGYLLIDPLFGAGDNLVLTLIVATWSAALAGAMGGATAMLSRLYHHISIEQDFQHHSLALYLIQPLTGALMGVIVLYLITIPGALLVNLMADPGASLTDISIAPTFIALQILLAWIAGFHQEIGLKKLRTVTEGFIPTTEAEQPPIPVAEAEEEPLLFREWYRRQQQVRRWSLTWGVFILVYGLVCLIGLLFSALIAMRWLPSLESGRHIAPNLILAAWPIAVAGGMGGVLSMLRNLYEHVSVARDFDRQHLMSYLVQPVLGAVFGFVIYFLLTTGFLTLDAARSNEASAGAVEPPVLTMIQLVLGWVAGFRNQFVADLINRVISRIVTFIKVVLKLLHPKNLFSKERRNEILAEIRGTSGPFHLSGLPRTPASAPEEGETISDWFTQP
jgi:hypothetical protein